MFKRFACFLLSMLLVVSIASADTDKEIVFHGIPWGISIDNLVKYLSKRKIDVLNSDIAAEANMAIWTYQFRNSYEHDIEESGIKINLSYWGNPGVVKIAGYPVQQLELYAHYGTTNGKINFKPANTKYYLTSIQFDVSDEMAVGVYEDLSKKLSALYMTGTENTTKIIDTTYTYTVWHGANDTAVCLYRSVSTNSNYQFVHLMYGKTNCEQTLREVRRLVIEHEIQSVAEDSTGL